MEGGDHNLASNQFPVQDSTSEAPNGSVEHTLESVIEVDLVTDQEDSESSLDQSEAIEAKKEEV